MSWFETAGLTSLARTAFKEAQRTIDKALDIQESGSASAAVGDATQDTTTTKLKEGTENFFAEFGIGGKKDATEGSAPDDTSVVASAHDYTKSDNSSSSSGDNKNASSSSSSKNHEKSTNVKSLLHKSSVMKNIDTKNISSGRMSGEAATAMAASLWGSFTESFYEASSKINSPNPAVSEGASSSTGSSTVVATQPHHSTAASSENSPSNQRINHTPLTQSQQNHTLNIMNADTMQHHDEHYVQSIIHTNSNLPSTSSSSLCSSNTLNKSNINKSCNETSQPNILPCTVQSSIKSSSDDLTSSSCKLAAISILSSSEEAASVESSVCRSTTNSSAFMEECSAAAIAEVLAVDAGDANWGWESGIITPNFDDEARQENNGRNETRDGTVTQSNIKKEQYEAATLFSITSCQSDQTGDSSSVSSERRQTTDVNREIYADDLELKAKKLLSQTASDESSTTEASCLDSMQQHATSSSAEGHDHSSTHSTAEEHDTHSSTEDPSGQKPEQSSQPTDDGYAFAPERSSLGSIASIDRQSTDVSQHQNKLFPITNCATRSDLPLTVQPSKSPLKISTMSTIIDSQITSSDRLTSSGGGGGGGGGGDKWGGSSQDEDYSDEDKSAVVDISIDDSSTTVAAADTTSSASGGEDVTETTITKQPVSRPSVSSVDAQKWDSFTEDVSASESMHSTSSSHTLIDSGAMTASQDMQSIEDDLNRDMDSSVQREYTTEQNVPSRSANSTPLTIQSSEFPSQEILQGNTQVKTDGHDGPPAVGLVSSMPTSNIVSSSVVETTMFVPVDSVLSNSLLLDVSVESGGSSDTITTSVESSQMLGSCTEGLEHRRQDTIDGPVIIDSTEIDGAGGALQEKRQVPRLLREAIGERDDFSSGVEPEAEAAVDEAGTSYSRGGSEDKQESSRGFGEADREHSQTSSESLNSEMVKVGSSEHTSGHSSGDEFETTTSSDIEVISSPSLDGMNAYNSSAAAGAAALLGPAHTTASRVWHSAQLRLKSLLVEPSPGAAKSGPNGTAPQDIADAAISPSMSASFTSISESDGCGEAWSIGGGSSSPPPSHSRSKRNDGGTSHYFERGHTRNQSNLSETSESSSELHTPEIEKLNKKVSQLNDVLEAREQRVMELSQLNGALQDSNYALQRRLQELETGGAGAEAVREEFTQRMATMEKKFQQALRDKESATRQLESLRVDAASRPSTVEVRVQLEERDTIIAELRSEGEKLSKQQLHYSTTIKKLRGKEKDFETTTAAQSVKITSQDTEIERQHKQLLAKSEVERHQVAAITQLTGSLQQSEELFKSTRANAAETEGKMMVLKEALDTAYRELADAKRQDSARVAELAEQSLSAELGAKQQLQDALYMLHQRTDREKEAMMLQIEELLEEKDGVQQQADRTERQVRAEFFVLQQQLNESEVRSEELSSAVAAATRPLLRQIENLQTSHSSHRQSWEELEAQLTYRLQESEKSTAVSSDRERNIREQSAQALSQKSALQAQVESVKVENSSLAVKVQSLTAAVSKMEEERFSLKRELAESRSSLSAELRISRTEAEKLATQLQLEKTALTAQTKLNESLKQHVADLSKRQNGENGGGVESGNISRQSSPTPSLSRLSIADSVSSLIAANWTDDVFESGSAVWNMRGSCGGQSSLYEALRGNTATTVEALTSQLSQREGEVHHLQSEACRHEAQRESLARELLQLTAQLEQLQQQLEQYQELQEEHQDTSQKYNALLQMYGEKIEEVEELRLDLIDVKDLYKVQINQLMQN